jgi:UDP-N-acetylmuramate--alanine ligase
MGRSDELKAGRHLTYHGQEVKADVHAANIGMNNGSYRFDVVMKTKTVNNLELHMGGQHNIENVTAAIAIAHELGIPDEKIRDAVAAFRGVKRRFEYIVKNDRQVFIDDYAHHPDELAALVRGAKSLFADKKCTLVFQPHLYSRTRDFADGFAASLDQADELILLPIYPARELPIEGVSSGMIKEKMKNSHVKVMEKQELLDWLKENKRELLITAGAGDIDTLVEPIKKILEAQ